MARIRWWIDGTATPRLEALVRDLDATLAGPGVAPRSRVGRKRFYRVEGPGEPALLVKTFAGPRGTGRLVSFARRSRARREADVARAIEERGFRAARPVAVGEERHGGLLARSISIVRELPLRDFRAILLDPKLGSERRRGLVVSFGRFVRRMHDAGIDQDDTSPNNFLVDDSRNGDDWVLIDFERCRVGKPLGERRWKLVAKLHRHGLGVSRADRLRFLSAYLGDGDRAERRRAWEKIRPAFFEVRTNDARRAAKGAFQEGRHVGRENGTWYVKGRENAGVVRLTLDAPQCRAIWTLAHVFERLGLPALRPVRLAADHVDLLAPELDEHAMDFHAAVARAKQQFAPYGQWVRDPQWALTKDGAILLTPTAFKLTL